MRRFKDEKSKTQFGTRQAYRLLITLVMVFLFVPIISQSPVDVNGKLSVDGKFMVNQDGDPVQLRGMSTHGLQWFANCIEFDSYKAITYDWGGDVLRLAMYIQEDGYETDPAYYKAYIDQLVDMCEMFGIYCIIDWHVHKPGDPNASIALARDFWDYMSKKHAGKDHVLYEICNEPNGVNWNTVKNYANEIIPIIRANDPNTIIICGTPTWSQDVDIASKNPLKFKNVMYTLHFYSGTHLYWLRDRVQTAINNNLPIFVTEFGTSQASGDGGPYFKEMDRWFEFLDANKISWVNWSFADKEEVSAALKVGACGSDYNNTSASGAYIKNRMLISDEWEDDGSRRPVLQIASPADGAIFTKDIGEINISADVYDHDGNVVRVQFFANGKLIGDVDKAPFSFNWEPKSDGFIEITAVATDNDGLSNKSLASKIEISDVQQVPYPVVTEPHTIPGVISSLEYDSVIGRIGQGIAYYDIDAVFKGDGPRSHEQMDLERNNIAYFMDTEWVEYTIKSKASGTFDITIECASAKSLGAFKLMLDGTDISEKIDVPATGGWQTYQKFTTTNVNISQGTHILRVQAMGNEFNVRDIIFEAGTVIYPPVVNLVSPKEGNSFSYGQVISITADASDEDGTVNKVDFFANNELIGTATSSPFSLDYTPNIAGNISIKVVATDNDKNTSYDEVSVFVDEDPCPGNTVPVVDLQVASSFDKGESIPMTAVVDDPDNEKILVHFYVDGEIVGSKTIEGSGNVKYRIKSLPKGTYILSVSATDECPTTGFSASQKIKVDMSCDVTVPQSEPLSSTGYTSFSHIFVVGDNGPDLNNVTNFTVNWDLQNKGLWQFSFQTNNGNPSWWNDLRDECDCQFDKPKPEMKCKGTGFDNFDGDYWVTITEEGDFVMAEKSGDYFIYYRKVNEMPCGLKSTENINSFTNIPQVYPVPASSVLHLNNIENFKQLTIS
ncbi:MAG: cellulase family glycosylhydrolase, partial [Bacteroidales bacterium]|nr:cellulase family glycosylhydrolase [Bacteroidales bacterium]